MDTTRTSSCSAGVSSCALETTHEALALAATRKVEVIRDETGAAINEYNRLAAAGRRVAALLVRSRA